MNSSGSPGRQRSISSIRKDSGPNTDAALELGRMIAAAYDDTDVTRHWMSHHLAALVVAAESQDDSVTVEQHIEIVDLILKVWVSRRSSPGDAPAYEIDRVFSALDLLGDDTPWRFSRLQDLARSLQMAADAEVPLIVKAANLETLTRKALLILIWRAFQEAIAKNEVWLATADAIAAETEDELVSSTRRVSRMLAELGGGAPWNPAAEVAEDKVATGDIARRLRGKAEELILLADELDGGTTVDDQ